ncbi:DUF2058 domain-containing protein [Thalassotalea euphylliae]|uniref:DUF2058 domain-containing protein n=1 Tax=Thalassotalea euphylliae TaxID=1655234 RepID=A0A3E0UCK5_9GAMM|nr:DUF2058 domain-containing protein [Thalassotalea euphylliae]REL34741.1 DUF2058 domain-containing protein [Thalassotalea euphylliae]
MASLQDQLLKAGLTTKQKARQANSDKRKKNKQKRSGAQVEASMQEQVKQDIAKQKEQKLAKDAALNAEKQELLAAKELHQRILQILAHHQVKDIAGEVEYNYTFGTKVKKLLVNELTQKALVNGRLSICGLDDVTYVVTKETADKLATLDESVVLLSNDKVEESVDEDDPYAAYQIPDDLMW